jgi:glyoxylase-like metal-dependent hydrolase (beta-lactamase superfamily II)
MRTWGIRVAIIACAIGVGGGLPVEAQTAESAPARAEMVDRFYRGRAVINEAVQAAGGAQALRGMTALSFVVAGDVSNDVQGYEAARIGNPARDGSQRVINRLDFAGQRFYQRVEQNFESGYDSAFSTVWRGGTQHAVRYVPRDYAENPNAPSPFGAGGAVMIASRWLPPIILQRALQNFRSVALVGESTVGGAAANVVEFSFDEVTRFRVHVTRADHRIRRVEALAPDPVSADDASVADLSGEQAVGGIVFPTRIVASRRGATTLNLALSDVAVNPTFTDADFAPPAGFAAQNESAQVRATQISGRVYEVGGLAGGTYQVPFVVMDDFVVAYEAPLGLPATRQVIAEIRRVAGDKPIRYVVVSHFHSDHAGGVGAYVEAGAMVLSSAENQAVLQTYASSNRPQFQGQEGPRADVRMQFQAIPPGGYDIIDGAGSRLRVVDFPRNSHVEHMLGLYDPDTGVFMGADHHIRAVAWNPTFEAFTRWVRRTDGVQTILGVHNRPMSRADFLVEAQRRRPEMRQRRVEWETAVQ